MTVRWKNIAGFMMMQSEINQQIEALGQGITPLQRMSKLIEDYRIFMKKRIVEDDGIQTHPVKL